MEIIRRRKKSWVHREGGVRQEVVGSGSEAKGKEEEMCDQEGGPELPEEVFGAVPPRKAHLVLLQLLLLHLVGHRLDADVAFYQA